VEYFFILPGLFSLYYVLRGQPEKAFLNVYLPCTFLVPYFYNFRIPHIPQLSAGDGALVPLGISLLFRPRHTWRFRRMDLWILIYVAGYAISELRGDESAKDGLSLWMQIGFSEIFLGYIVGRQIIEPELRLATIKRLIFLFMLQTPFALWEYRMGSNPWMNIGRIVFRVSTAWFVQLRGGTARISTCFSGAIVAGMMFMVAAALNYYLLQIYKLDNRILGPRMSWLQKYRLPFFLLPIFVFMTGSRMPLASLVLVFLFLQIPRFKSLRTGTIVILLVAATGVGAFYAYYEKYTSVSPDQVTDERQSSAIYRKQLVINYAPILEAGGWLGWGTLNPPLVIGQSSIDNGYMLVQLAQGKLGNYLFKLMAFEAILALALSAARFRNKESLFLVFSLMGALIGLFASLTTVGMGEQTPQVLFLLLGWSQSVQDTRVGAAASEVNSFPEPKYRFKRVIA
jgi:hypothetical protein